MDGGAWKVGARMVVRRRVSRNFSRDVDVDVDVDLDGEEEEGEGCITSASASRAGNAFERSVIESSSGVSVGKYVKRGIKESSNTAPNPVLESKAGLVDFRSEVRSSAPVAFHTISISSSILRRGGMSKAQFSSTVFGDRVLIVHLRSSIAYPFFPSFHACPSSSSWNFVFSPVCGAAWPAGVR